VSAAGGSGLAIGTLVPHRGPIGWEQIRSLIDAAADAGFSGIEFRTAYHDWAVSDGATSQEFFDYPRERGLSMLMSEVIESWMSTDARAIAEANAEIIDVTARAGASSVLAVARQLPSLEEAVVGLTHLCDLAAERGLAVTLEFLPYAGLRDIATTARLMESVDRDNLGLCLDTWHWSRQPGGPDIEALRAIPPSRIHMLQLADASRDPSGDLSRETLTARLLPGEGVVDIAEVLGVLDEIGASPVVVSEVFSSSLAALDPLDNARRQATAMAAVLAAHRDPSGAADPGHPTARRRDD
jgi:sugar phosphate isomerase/epimerase